MKPQRDTRQVESNSLGTKEFSIQASGKMFHMVISGLYSDKPGSITREIYSNAFDAHAMVGKQDVPFDVIYPTSMDPTFTVRDYGPGIHHDAMEDFYTVLGHSTKENTNQAVGKWGVGRMSPMSYTDSFSVTSRHKGMKAYYSVQMGAGGAPSLHTMAPPHATDEPDGLEVSFPIDRQDLHKFSQAARRMALGLKVKPNVLNDSDPFTDPEIVIQGQGFNFFKHPDFSGYGEYGTFAQMGCVLYKIDPNYVPVKFQRNGLNLLIEFPIGDLDVTASREDLSYDDTTKENIRKAFQRVEKGLGDLIEKEVKSAPNLISATKKWAEVSSSLGFRESIFWRGEEITNRNYRLPDDTALKFGLVRVSGRRVSAGFTAKTSVDTHTLKKVFVQDLNKKSKDVRAPERVMSVSGAAYRDSELWVKYDSSDPQQVKDLKAFVKDAKTVTEVVFVKDIPDPGPRSSTRRKVEVKRLLKGSYYWTDYTLPSEDFKSGGTYVCIRNQRLECGKLSSNSLTQKGMGLLGLDSVIVVPKTLWKRFQDADNWKELTPQVEAELNKDTKAKVDFAFSRWEGVSFLSRMNDIGLGPDVKSLFPQKPSDKYNVSTCDMKELLAVFSKLPDGKQTPDEAFRDATLAKYPLLSLYRSGMEAEFKEYIRLVDAQDKINLAA